MKEVWTTSVSVLLTSAAVLAELNLLRVFLRDRREARRQAPAPRRTRHLGLAAGLMSPTLLMGSTAFGQQSPPATPPGAPATAAVTQPAAPAEAAKSPFSLQLNLDYTTSYFYHGIIQEDTGLILQPAAKLTINLYDEPELKIDAFLGTWNSFHGQKTAAQTHGDFTEYWYESDLLGGFTLTKGKLAFTTTYIFLTSPSDAYETVQELDLTLALDDSEWLDKFALHPYAMIAFETGADASDGAQSDTGTYLELGIAPGFSVGEGDKPVAITFPVTAGFSLNNYYQDSDGKDDAFGFVQIAAKAAIPLGSGRYGTWTLNTGVGVILLGDNASAYNGDQDQQLFGTVGIQVNF